MDDEISKLNYNDVDFQRRYRSILSFIHQNTDSQTLKNELISYARIFQKESIVEAIPHSRIGVEGKIAYCLNRGATLPPASHEKIHAVFNTKFSSISDDVDFEEIEESTQAKNTRAYVNCYSLLDNAKTQVLNGKLSIRDLPTEVRKIMQERSLGKSSVVKLVHDHYKQMHKEAIADPAIATWVKPLAVIVETVGFMLNNRAAIKAGAKNARSRKMNSTLDQYDRRGEKAASKMSYKDEDENLGIRSIDPTNIIGASVVVVFNTKNRHCEVYFAGADSKLSVQGAKIINFDTTASFGKTLRNPNSDLPHWTRATNLKRIEVLSKDIKGKRWEVTGKLNRNCIIVKVL